MTHETHRETADYYSKYARQFDQTIAALENYGQSYLDFLAKAPRKSKLLDLACGPGNVSAFIQKQLPEIAITCVDLSPEMLKLAQSKIGTGNFYEADLLNLTIPPEKYDLVCCAFGFPYISRADVPKVIEQMERFCDHNSAVYISCMQGDHSQLETLSFGGNEQVLVHYHTREAMVHHFAAAGFWLADYQELNYFEQDGNMTIDMIFNFIKT